MKCYNKKIISTLALLIFSVFTTQTFSCNSDQKKNNAEYVDKNTLFQDKSKLDDEISKSRKNILTETVKNVSPAVVGINVTQIRQYQIPSVLFLMILFLDSFLVIEVHTVRK